MTDLAPAPEVRPCALCGGALGPVTFAWNWTDPDDATEEVHHFAAHLACEHLRKFVFDLSEWEDGEAPVVGALFENATSGTGTDEVIIDENLWRRYADGIPADQRDGLDVLRAQLEEQVRAQRGGDAPEASPADCDDCPTGIGHYGNQDGYPHYEDVPPGCDDAGSWEYADTADTTGPGDNAPTPDTRPLLTPTEGWALTPPDDSGTWEPFAALDGENSDFYWIPKGCDDPGDAFDDSRIIPYPFGDQWCVEADLTALGFRVDL